MDAARRIGAMDQASRLGEAMKLLRARRRLSQSALAQKMGKSPTNIARMETDQNPTWNTVAEALAAMGYGFDDLSKAILVVAGVLPDFDYEHTASARDQAVIDALVVKIATLEAQLKGSKPPQLSSVSD